MLEGLRVASQNWIGRALMALVMGVIVVSFAIWGVGDVFRGMTTQRLARVGCRPAPPPPLPAACRLPSAACRGFLRWHRRNSRPALLPLAAVDLLANIC